MKQSGQAWWRRGVEAGRTIKGALGTAALTAAAWVEQAQARVNDLPGGPAVNQLNFHPPATRIAEEQH
ncbi:MAG: hypothetical protein N2Z66_02525, partial [Tepidimonas sp.]|nr:hypothetical protein [Tepidimonas sp.]